MNMPSPGGMSASTIQILLQIQANQQAAATAKKALDDTKKSIDDVEKSASKLKTAGRELREVGGYIAAGGAAMLAPFILAANTYEQKYKGLEPIANNFALAQRKQADATVQFGRVAAQALTPFLNDVANVEQKIANFATAHPDIVQAVVGGGALLVGVGTGFIAVGQALVTVANAAKLLGASVGGLAGSFGILAVGLGVGIPLTIKGLNALADTLNRPDLKHITLGDVLNTGAQAIAIAVAAVVTVFNDFVGGLKLIQADIQHATDPNWTKANIAQLPPLTKAMVDAAVNQGYKGAQALVGGQSQQIPGMLNTGGGGHLDLRTGQFIPASATGGTVYSPSVPPLGVPRIDPALARLIAPLPPAVQQRIHNLDDLKAYYASQPGQFYSQFPTPASNAAPMLSPRDIFQQQLQGEATGATNTFLQKLLSLTGAGGGGGGAGGGTSTDVSASVNAYIKYLQQVKQADIQFGIEKVRIATEYNNETSKIEKDRATEAVQIARDRANQVQQLDQEQERAKVKRLEDFNHNEAMTEERLKFERQQKLYEMSLQANELAVQGDVAGFIAAQQQNRIQVLEQDRQNAFDKKQRQEQFDFEQKQQDKADQVARDQQKRQFAIEDQDRRAQYQKEDADRKTAYDNQLTALQVSHQNQADEMQRAFVQQLADLEDNVAGLHTIQQNANIQMSSDFDTFSKQMTTKWQNLYTNLLGIGSPAPPSPTVTPSPGGSFFAAGGTLGSGWNVVGERGPEWIHGASRMVVPMQRSSGGASISISMPITIEGGSGAGGITQADLKAWGEQIVMHVGATIQREAAAL